MHPVAYSAAYEGEDRNRLTTFFRFFVALPWFFVLMFYGIAVFFTVIAAWFALVFTGRYPEGLYRFNSGFLRAATRVTGFFNLLTDELPPFNGDEHPEYPIRLLIGPAKEEYSRAKAGFRIFLLIPVHILNYVMQLILQVVAFIAWVIIVFTGKMPIGLYRPLRIAAAYGAKATAYSMLLTEDFPPFWQDEEEEAPRFDRSGPGLPAEPTTALGL